MKKILLMVAGVVLSAPFFVSAQVAQIQALSDQFTTDTQAQGDCVDLKYNLSYRSRDARTNNEVSLLQDFLITQGYLSGESTGYFGAGTRAAVRKFQAVSLGATSATPGYGGVGPKSRAKIKEMTCGGSVAIPAATQTSTPVAVSSQTQTTTTSAMPPSMPAGCVSTLGYSSMTGQKCDSTTTVPQVATPTITVLSPNGGETFSVSDSISVKYSVSNLPVSTELTAYLYNPINGNIASNLTVGPVSGNGVDSIYLALSKVANIPTGQYKITLCALSVSSPAVSFKPLCDSSDNYFTINAANTQSAAPSITVLSPNGGEQIKEGATQTIIKWSTKNLSGLNVSIDLVDSTGYVTNIASNISNTGYYYWNTAAGVKGGYLGGYSYKIRISSNDKGPSAVDDSDSYFGIATATTETIATAVPTVEVISTPKLSLQYDSVQKESALVANYNVSITAPVGANFKLYKYGAFDNDTYAFLVSLNDAKGANGASTNGNYYKVSGLADDNGNYWMIPAGQTASFNLAANLSHPKTLFAGSYNATLSLYKPSGGAGIAVNGSSTTNSVTIIGETAPYLSSVVADATPDINISISGIRFFNATANSVTMNGVTRVLPSSNAAATLLNTTAKDFGITTSGNYSVQVSTSEGASNFVNVTVTVPTTSVPTIFTISPSQGSANTTVTIYGTNLSGASSVHFYSSSGQIVAEMSSPSISPISSTTLTFTIGGIFAANVEAGTYQVKVVTPSGTSNGSSFTLIAPSAQSSSQFASVLDAFSPASAPALVPVPTPTPTPTWAYSWTRNLEVGSFYRDDIIALQTALAKDGVYTGEVTGGFYSQTYLGVKAFQAKYGIESTGFVGPQTRAKLNELY